MGFFDKFKKDKDNVEKKENQNVSSQNFSNTIQINDRKYINLSNVSVIPTKNGTDLYLGEIFQMNSRSDTIYYAGTSPVAFELPANRQDLISTFVKTWGSIRDAYDLSDVSYTFLGNIREEIDGKLYYHNEPPTEEIREIMDKAERIFQARRRQERRNVEERGNRQEEIDFRNRIEANISYENNITYTLDERERRKNNPYFISKGEEEYDLVNLENGKIITLRNMTKAKDTSGRYLYTAYVSEQEREGYTELLNVPTGHQIAFTTPTRLADLVNMQMQDTQMKNILIKVQKLLSQSMNDIEKLDLYRGLIDIGGVSLDGRIIKNTEKDGVSRPIIDKIQSLGGRAVDDFRADRSR